MYKLYQDQPILIQMSMTKILAILPVSQSIKIFGAQNVVVGQNVIYQLLLTVLSNLFCRWESHSLDEHHRQEKRYLNASKQGRERKTEIDEYCFYSSRLLHSYRDTRQGQEEPPSTTN